MRTPHSSDSDSRSDRPLPLLTQDRIAQLELNLEEERQSGDQLMDRIDRGREQVQLVSGSPVSLCCSLTFTQTCLFLL